MDNTISYLFIGISIWILVSVQRTHAQPTWVAPPWTDTLKNPLRPTSSVLLAGEQLYITYCGACHGQKGLGDGALGPGFPVKPANFHSPTIQQQQDGALFWKLTEGRGAMPAYKTSLSDKKRWELVTYIRKLVTEEPSKANTQVSKNVLAITDYTIESGIESTYFPLPDKISNIYSSDFQIFMVDTVVSGLERPWGMVFLPDDSTLLITERKGTIRRIKNGKLTDTIGGQVPNGLRDIQLHPAFKQNGLIYLTYYIEPTADKGGYTVLMRGKLDGGNLINDEVLYKAGPFKEGGETYGSRIAFDRKGLLYMTVGQRTMDERHRWLTVQDKTNPSGKVMRFNDDGSIPPTNPFVDTAGALSEIFTYGHRQPQGLRPHPKTGEMWETEHGEMGGSELNLLQPGANYGWPLVTYSRNYDGTIIAKDTTRFGMKSPVHHWTPSIAPSGFDFVTGGHYPQWDDNLFVGAMVQNRLNRTDFSSNSPLHDERLLEGIGRIRDVRLGPDHLLYLMIEDTGQIIRLIPLTNIHVMDR